jgi:hypothetical protein
MKSKYFISLASIVLIFLVSSQFAYAGGGGGSSGGKSGGGVDLNPFDSPAVKVVTNVVVDTGNIVTGVVKDVAGAVVYETGKVTGNQTTIDSGNALFKSASGNYENAVGNLSSINNLTNQNAFIGSADPESCTTDGGVILVGSTGTWTGRGGVVGATFDFSGTDNFSQTVNQATLNGTVSASHTYQSIGIQTASVHWSDKSQSGNINCSGSITVVANPNQLNQNQNQNNQNNPNGNGNGNGNGSGQKNGAGGSLPQLGSISDPISLDTSSDFSVCAALPQTASASGNIYPDASANWTFTLPKVVPTLLANSINITWSGDGIATTNTTSFNLSKVVYSTVGAKAITAKLIGADAAGTYYSATCTATTTVKTPTTSVKNI